MPQYDFNGLDYDSCDASAVPLPPGWYKCLILDVYEDENKPGDFHFVFEVVQGPYKGRRQHERLNHPDNCAKPEGAAKRCAIFAKRLGLWQPDQAQPDIDWTKCIGKTVAIQVCQEEYTDKQGTTKRATKLTFAGIHSDLTHHDIPVELRQPAPPASEQAPPETPQPKQPEIPFAGPLPGRQRRPSWEDL